MCRILASFTGLEDRTGLGLITNHASLIGCMHLEFLIIIAHCIIAGKYSKFKKNRNSILMLKFTESVELLSRSLILVHRDGSTLTVSRDKSGVRRPPPYSQSTRSLSYN